MALEAFRIFQKFFMECPLNDQKHQFTITYLQCELNAKRWIIKIRYSCAITTHSNRRKIY